MKIKIKNFWKKKKIFKTYIDITLKKYYCLSMIPYPSGDLHIGHVKNYVIGDIISRYQRMHKKNVLFPIAWDSFGLPAENAALNNNKLPETWIKNNILNMKIQLIKLNISYDWYKEFTTSNSNYCYFEQLFFIKLFQKGLIYKKLSLINWCKNDKTVLANEQIINHRCWRCNNLIYKKYINQFYFKINQYSINLEKNLSILKNWPYKVKEMQKNWIKNYYLYFFIFKIKQYNIIVYVENINYLNYSKFLIIKNIHPLLNFIIKKNQLDFLNKLKINFIFYTNLYTKYLFNKNKINIKISNFLIKEEKIFAKIFSSLIRNKKNNKIIKKILFKFNLLFIIKKSILKDWCISRQRLWGNSIPLFYNRNYMKLISYNKLPILSNNKYYINFNKFFNLNIQFNKNYFINYYKNILEKDTLDTFFESSWYYLKFTLNYINNKKLNKNYINYWLPIDIYIGGIEHANMHLIYIRFFNKIFFNYYKIKYNEPILELICQGMIIAHAYYYKQNNLIEWINEKYINNNNNILSYKSNKVYKYKLCKISKTKKNGIDINSILIEFNSDILRLGIMFLSPIEKTTQWNWDVLTGMSKFLSKLKKFILNNHFLYKNFLNINKFSKQNISDINKIFYFLNKINNLIKLKKFNVTIANIISYFNFIKKIKTQYCQDKNIILYAIKNIIKILYIFTPNFSFKLWFLITKKKNIDFISWINLNKQLI